MFASKTVRILIAAMSVALAISACSSDDAALVEPPLACATDLDEIITLLQSGLPTFDYDPAANLDALMQRSNAVVGGSLGRFERSDIDEGAESGETVWTMITPQAPIMLFSYPTERDIAVFSSYSLRPEGAGPDPLKKPVSTSGVRFVAFLHQADNAPGGYTVDVQGLAVGCAGDPSPALPVIEPLPPDAAALSFEHLFSLVRDNARNAFLSVAPPLDGPVIRWPELGDSSAVHPSALVTGTLQRRMVVSTSGMSPTAGDTQSSGQATPPGTTQPGASSRRTEKRSPLAIRSVAGQLRRRGVRRTHRRRASGAPGEELSGQTGRRNRHREQSRKRHRPVRLNRTGRDGRLFNQRPVTPTQNH